jgi:polysaccharide biosynthesis transport protein
LSIQRSNLPILAGNDQQVPMLPAADEELAGPGMSMAQIMSIVRANLRRSLITFFVLVLLFGFVIKILPHSFVATATLIVNRGDKNPLASPDFPNGGWDASYIPTQIELIESPAVLQPVIDRLNLRSDPEFTAGFRGPPAALREAVLTSLARSLNVSAGSGSDLLYISASAKYPDQAADIANAVATEYLQLNRQRVNDPAEQRAQLYARELEQLRQAAITAQEQVTAFRQQHGMVDLAPANGDEAEAALDDLEQKLIAAQNQERSVQAQLQARAWGPGSQADTAPDSLSTELGDEETQLAKLKQTLGPRHPTVLALESQIAATERGIRAGLDSQLAEARKLVAQYSTAVAAQRSEVLQRRRVQDEGSKLLLELQSAEATYKRALDGYSEIQFATTGASNDVSLVSRAVPPVLALKPNKGKYFLGSCVLSLGLAFGIPFAYELLLNRRLRCSDDLERHFGIPVLAHFGPIPHDR